MLLIKRITHSPRSADNPHTARRIRVTAYRYWIVLDWQMHRTPIRSRDRLRRKLLLDMLFHVLELPRPAFVSAKSLPHTIGGDLLLYPINN